MFRLLLIGSAVVLLLLCGCSASPKISDMLPTNPAAIERESTGKTIRIELPDWVNEPGGWEKAFGTGGIDPETYYEALRAAIGQSGLFTQVDPETEADYTLIPTITGQSGDGVFSVMATLFVDYEIQKGETSEIIWSEEILGRHTASCGSSPIGAYRLRSAREGAARDSLAKLIAKLAALNL